MILPLTIQEWPLIEFLIPLLGPSLQKPTSFVKALRSEPIKTHENQVNLKRTKMHS